MSDDSNGLKFGKDGVSALFIYIFSVVTALIAFELTGSSFPLGDNTHPVAGMSLACALVMLVWSNALAARAVLAKEVKSPAIIVIVCTGIELIVMVTLME
jgi:hypothetical protein